MPNLVNGWIFQNWAKISLDLRKVWKNWVILLKILPKIKQIGTFNGSIFLENLVFTWYFGLLSKSAAAHPYQNQTWVPPGSWDDLFFIFQIPKLHTPGLWLKVWFGQGCSSVTWHSCIPTPIKGALHLLPQISMFCALSQNYQHCLEKWYMHLIVNCLRNSKMVLKF